MEQDTSHLSRFMLMQEISVADLLEIYFSLHRESLIIHAESFDKNYLKVSICGSLRGEGVWVNKDLLIRKGAYQQVMKQLTISDLDLKCLKI
ncbi:hypothetical protein [uncultured Veillonella sp.]|uniref:hypothetical protein n=1 Tax=uncultured Veillonella sp. TaxID=159268 RepID=UPI002600CF44|nr:hypothetical protein [uncultured Veillonella sp.]MDY3974493.1 hypothetical protein [Veillonella caviae]